MKKPTKGTIAIAISSALLMTNSYSYGNNGVSSQQSSQEIRLAYAGTEQQQWNAYARSQYTYNDAELLAKHWGKATILDAKYKIGSLLISRNNTAIQQSLQQARQPQWNAYADSQYSYDDAKLLAKYWGKATILDTKYKIGSLLLSRNNAAIQQSLQQARQPHLGTEQQQWNAYAESQYTYDDAELLAKYWGKATILDTKYKIGSLLLSRNNAAIEQSLEQAQEQDPRVNKEQQQWNAYAESQYTYNDVKLLAKYWGKATVWDAKLKIGILLISGNNVVIQQALQQAGQQPIHTERQ